MKTKATLLYKAPMFLSAIFFMGMITSAYFLFMVEDGFDTGNLAWLRVTIGITLLVGLITIYITSTNKDQKIVYIQKSDEIASKETEVRLSELSQLEVQPILNVIKNASSSLSQVLTKICKQLQAGQGAIYAAGNQELRLTCGYALSVDKMDAPRFAFGEGLVGRVAVEKNALYIDKLPKDYMTIFSGLGSASPSFLLLVPIANETEVKGVLEISTFHPLNEVTIGQLKEVAGCLTELIQS